MPPAKSRRLAVSQCRQSFERVQHLAIEAATLSRETDRLRKRYQLLKDELGNRARKAGLINDKA
jgi:hypothetical protein